jgi:hypothetical protein
MRKKDFGFGMRFKSQKMKLDGSYNSRFGPQAGGVCAINRDRSQAVKGAAKMWISGLLSGLEPAF